MALLLFTSPLSSPSSSTSAPTAHPFFRFCNISISLQHRSYTRCIIREPLSLESRGSTIVRASSDVEGAGSSAPEPPTPPTDSNVESVPVENLPLESKLQLQLEQKMRMKKAKKIRLRRKSLVRKRHLRKKGRWPPSKLKKNKNVLSCPLCILKVYFHQCVTAVHLFV